jgi:hypothetical protein
MIVDWELEDWLLDTGGIVEVKAIAGGILSPIEQLIREFWVFDMQTRNGGVSQYFVNYGREQWMELHAAWLPELVPSLEPILNEVDRLIAGEKDAYLATLEASPKIEEFYESYQLAVRRELRRAYQN